MTEPLTLSQRLAVYQACSPTGAVTVGPNDMRGIIRIVGIAEGLPELHEAAIAGLRAEQDKAMAEWARIVTCICWICACVASIPHLS